MKNLLSLDDQKESLNKNVLNNDDNQEKDDSILLPGDGNYLKSKIESDIWQQFEDDERLREKDPHETKITNHDESTSRNSLCLFQDALQNISPLPEDPDLTEAIKTVLRKTKWDNQTK